MNRQETVRAALPVMPHAFEELHGLKTKRAQLRRNRLLVEGKTRRVTVAVREQTHPGTQLRIRLWQDVGKRAQVLRRIEQVLLRRAIRDSWARHRWTHDTPR